MMATSRRLNGIAYSIAHKFSVSANHFAYMAREAGTENISVNLVTGEILPREYQKERNTILVNQCIDNFRRLLQKQCSPAIDRAELNIRFKESDGGVFGEFRVNIYLPEGKIYSGLVESDIPPQK